jgi:hypothetical protein
MSNCSEYHGVLGCGCPTKGQFLLKTYLLYDDNSAEHPLSRSKAMQAYVNWVLRLILNSRNTINAAERAQIRPKWPLGAVCEPTAEPHKS